MWQSGLHADNAAGEGTMIFDDLIIAERIQQDKKWGQQDHLPIEWLGILSEEVGELAQAIVNRHFSKSADDGLQIQLELIQVAAVARSIWECGERNHWWLPTQIRENAG